MWQEIATWQETLKARPDLSAKTVALYTQDARRFATWVQHEHPGLKTIEVTPTDAKTYRDHLLYPRRNGMQFGDVQRLPLDVITDWPWRWPPCSAMRVHGSRRSQPSRFLTCK